VNNNGTVWYIVRTDMHIIVCVHALHRPGSSDVTQWYHEQIVQSNMKPQARSKQKKWLSICFFIMYHFVGTNNNAICLEFTLDTRLDSRIKNSLTKNVY